VNKTSVCVVAILVSALLAGAGGAAAAGESPPDKPSVSFKGKSIVLKRAKGELLIEGDVRVTRTSDGRKMTVLCDRLTAKMKDDALETAQATGSVRVEMEQVKTTSARAEFDFKKNIIKLHGTKKTPATMKTAEMRSTGPTIIFHLDDEQVKMPDGGETEVILRSSGKEE
jgi:lipopolysaccharide export system protein LptA